MLNKLEHLKMTWLEGIPRNQFSMTLNRGKERGKVKQKHILSFGRPQGGEARDRFLETFI